MIEALTAHYWTKTLSPGAMKVYVSDWIDDIGHLPADILKSACQQWRRGDNAFMPTPGQLLAIAEPILSFRKRLCNRANELMGEV